MPTPTAPIKTPLGQDELRHRTRGLGQRHRTILLLVDGRRPVSEVLSLALKAGAETSHFEELVRLGLVELPTEAMAPEPRETAPGSLDQVRVTSVELEVPEEPEVSELPETAPPVALAPPPLTDVVEPELPDDVGTQLPMVHDEPPVAHAEAAPAAPHAPPVLRIEILPPPAPAARPEPAARLEPVARPAPVQRPVARPMTAPQTSFTPVASSPAVPVQKGDDAWLQRVRELLVDTLRLDAPLFSARTFVRVRSAQSATELIDLVWEIEHHLSHARHSRSELISLQRAREMLGLGNTLVAYDSEPGPDDW
ncbi:hypothetical protein [Piscinibacter sp.]|jgi:hypothetical protein|uniref:hypothetical protein n=1 Tax=Piscinibacter sp. TaxID=1903157 RepID=UPI00355A615D